MWMRMRLRCRDKKERRKEGGKKSGEKKGLNQTVCRVYVCYMESVPLMRESERERERERRLFGNRRTMRGGMEKMVEGRERVLVLKMIQRGGKKLNGEKGIPTLCSILSLSSLSHSFFLPLPLVLMHSLPTSLTKSSVQ